MTILAIDCTATPASAAILKDEKTVSSAYTNIGLTHSQTLVPMIVSMMKNAGVSKDSIDYMAINVGPGSFTGVRIGVAALKGIDFDGGEDCIEVSTLHSMAYNYCGVKDVIVCSVMDARCQQVYTANFDICGDKVTRMTEDRAISIEALVNELQSCEKPVVFVGDGASLCYNYVNQFKGNLLTNVSLAPQQLRFQNAVATAMCAQHMLDEGYAPVSADKVLPIYLRAPQAERELKKKQTKED